MVPVIHTILQVATSPAVDTTSPASPPAFERLVDALPRLFLATAILGLIIWGLRWLSRRVRQRITAREGPFGAVRIGSVELISADRVARFLDLLVLALFWFAVLVAIDIYLWRVLGMSDATRSVGERLRDYVWIPFRNMIITVWDYLPNLLTIVLVIAVARLLLWVVHQVFKAVQVGALSIPGFDRDWANPTYRVVRVLGVGLALAIIFPLLPAYDSDAFKGLSIFGGFLLAFGSSGAVGNLVAGVFLTYTRACKTGDRVQIGDTLGDVQEQTFLAVRIRTDRQQVVTIPSSVVLNSSVTNYTRRGLEQPTILHTGVTIGYDAPWRKVHELLLKAALETPDVLSFPEPFVWQKALSDFYVSYELNVATTKPERMYWILDELHRRIQDNFFAAGVEIMSPHFYSLRDGNAVAMPEAQRPPGYQAPAFHVRGAEPAA
jgi:small-conductance mechanosensitive channel